MPFHQEPTTTSSNAAPNHLVAQKVCRTALAAPKTHAWKTTAGATVVDQVALSYDSAGNAHYFLQDANFNVTALLDSTRDVVERYAYTPYGETTVLNPDFSAAAGNVSAISNELLYTGRRLDPETGLQLNRNRFYHQQLGRWVSRDPIGYRGGTNNLYEYVNGKPTTSIDPHGHARVGKNKKQCGPCLQLLSKCNVNVAKNYGKCLGVGQTFLQTEIVCGLVCVPVGVKCGTKESFLICETVCNAISFTWWAGVTKPTCDLAANEGDNDCAAQYNRCAFKKCGPGFENAKPKL